MVAFVIMMLAVKEVMQCIETIAERGAVLLPFSIAKQMGNLGQDLFGGCGAGAFAFPFVVFAEAGDVFFDLGFEFGEGGFANGGKMFAFVGGMKRTSGKGQI